MSRISFDNQELDESHEAGKPRRCRLSKAERHAWRRAVRRAYLIPRSELWKVPEVHRRIVMAEMRKRGFWYQPDHQIWRNPAMLPGAFIDQLRRRQARARKPAP